METKKKKKKLTRTKLYLRQAAKQTAEQTGDLVSTNGYEMYCKRMCIKRLPLK